MLRDIVVIGASLAGLRAAEALRLNGFAGNLTIVGEENVPPYNRPPLSKQILTGKYAPDDLRLPCADDLGARWALGRRATGLDVAGRLDLDDGTTLAFDGAIVATGVSPRRPTVPGAALPGVHVLRTLDDALALKAALLPGRRLVVAGAGFIGCEVAASARQLGLEVTVIDPAPAMMGRVLASELSSVFEAIHRDRGVAFLPGRTVTAIEGAGHVEAVMLDDGTRCEADVVVFGIGSLPATGWLEGSGLTLANGLVCDEFCLALGGEGRIAAAGDVAAWRNPAYGGALMRVEHWSNAVDQAAAAAANLLAERKVPYAPLMSLWSDQYEFKLQALGAPALGDRTVIAHGSLPDRKFVAECWAGERLVGVIGVNMPPRVASYRGRLTEEIAIHAA